MTPLRAGPVEVPAPVEQPEVIDLALPQFAPLYNVVLIDDDEHTYQYVITMLCTIFEVGFEMAFMMARAVDTEGRVVVHTTDLETAKRERDQILSFGPDPLLPGSRGSMHAVVEPLPGA